MEQTQLVAQSPKGNSLQKTLYHLSDASNYLLWLSQYISEKTAESVQNMLLSSDNQKLLQERKQNYHPHIQKLKSQITQHEHTIQTLEQKIMKLVRTLTEQQHLLQSLLEQNARYLHQSAYVLGHSDLLPHQDLAEHIHNHFSAHPDNLATLNTLIQHTTENFSHLHAYLRPYQALDALSQKDHEHLDSLDLPPSLKSLLRQRKLCLEQIACTQELSQKICSEIEKIFMDCLGDASPPPMGFDHLFSRVKKTFSDRCAHWLQHLPTLTLHPDTLERLSMLLASLLAKQPSLKVDAAFMNLKNTLDARSRMAHESTKMPESAVVETSTSLTKI